MEEKKPPTHSVNPLQPLKGEALKSLIQTLGEKWRVVDEHHLEKEYRFASFRQAHDFTNDVGHLAEEEGHHPVIVLQWGQVTLTFWTHAIDGLSHKDFTMAAKCDACFLARHPL